MFACAPRQDNRELIASISTNYLTLTQTFLYHSGDFDQRMVSDGMTVRVVYLFELIEIKQDGGKRLVCLDRTDNFFLAEVEELASV